MVGTEHNLQNTTSPMWERAGSGRRSDDSGVTVHKDIDCNGLIASRLAPTEISVGQA
ncbi:hypothetical protein HK44_009550 [Pseudomonas fluorescens HK44]|uniref:Uncharacterized protein n=1 Tax=Pseudomonas fluorescens HK44 TaxID=1042209 RepID=A0A010SMI6_PSEFL|nr:hypothetical protein HK44_009550 [Pseudomonas fluorescens HK44]